MEGFEIKYRSGYPTTESWDKILKPYKGAIKYILHSQVGVVFLNWQDKSINDSLPELLWDLKRLGINHKLIAKAKPPVHGSIMVKEVTLDTRIKNHVNKVQYDYFFNGRPISDNEIRIISSELKITQLRTLEIIKQHYPNWTIVEVDEHKIGSWIVEDSSYVDWLQRVELSEDYYQPEIDTYE